MKTNVRMQMMQEPVVSSQSPVMLQKPLASSQNPLKKDLVRTVFLNFILNDIIP